MGGDPRAARPRGRRGARRVPVRGARRRAVRRREPERRDEPHRGRAQRGRQRRRADAPPRARGGPRRRTDRRAAPARVAARDGARRGRDVRPPLTPDRSADAPWKQRFHTSLFADLQIAAGDRRSAVVSSNDSGVFQTYALELGDGAMRQLTQADAGTVLAYLAGDGRSLLTLDDAGGNEVGHWVSIPVDGGDPTDLTPEMPAYSSWSVATDRAEGHVAIAITSDDGTEVWIASLADTAAPRRFAAMWGLVPTLAFSADGGTLYCLSSEPTRSNAYAVVVFDTVTGDRLGELWDGAPSSMYGLVAEPSGDRIATSSNLIGRVRPLLWNPRDGKRVDLPLDLPGDVDVLDWSDDGHELLLAVTDRAEETLVRYDLESRTAHAIDLRGGSFGPDARFGPDGDVIVVRSSAADAPEIVAVDAAGTRVISRRQAPPGTALRSV